ncbi:MAG TPA: YvcK family protein, partial [Firmicutes bacterium]|nr:YvcK family protein [Bacillota bacterium]
MGKGPKIVTLGGGTGLSVLLRGLKEYTGNITAIVTVTDTGGSSGRLREELGILPPGDIRNCLVALADTEPLMESLFQHRFQTGEGLAGHNLGNLFLAGLTEILGDFSAAVRQASRVLAVQGQVLPSTLENVTLQAELATGETVIGETNITSRGGRIRHLSL